MSRRNSRKRMSSFVAEIGPDDGIDPRELARPTGQKTSRKGLQLCSQIREALYWVLGSAVGDPQLAYLEIASVEPLGNTSQMLIVLLVPAEMDLEAISAKVHAAKRAIRCEIAASIHRRKVPELIFRLVPR